MKKKDILQNLKFDNAVWLIQHQKMNMYKYVLVLRSKSKFFKDHKIAWATRASAIYCIWKMLIYTKLQERSCCYSLIIYMKKASLWQ